MTDSFPASLETHSSSRFKKATVTAFTVLILAAVGMSVYYLSQYYNELEKSSLPRVTPVRRGDFKQEIYGTGSAESAHNTLLVNQVMGPSTITYLVPEGNYVEEGEILLQLDTHNVDETLNNFQKQYFKFNADVIQRQSNLHSNEIALEKYIEGTFEQNILEIDKNIYNYSEALKQGIDNLENSESLLANGYTTAAQVDVDRVGCRKAQNNLKSYLLRRDILVKYTSERQIITFLSRIEAVRSGILNFAWVREIYRGLVERYTQQVEFCTIRAPHAGRVAYANQIRRRWRRQSDMIKEGGIVYLWQELLLLPDPNFMQIRAKINETHAILLKEGMKAEMRFSALSDKVFYGEIVKVNQYPEVGWMSSVKDYTTLIKIENPTDEIRTGLTAECIITAGIHKNKLQVPRSSVVESGGKMYCLTLENNKPVCHEVALGLSNENVVIIEEGLEENTQVVANALPLKSQVQFPVSDLPSIYGEEYSSARVTGSALAISDEKAPATESKKENSAKKTLDKSGDTTDKSSDGTKTKGRKEAASGKSVARYDDVKETIKAERKAQEEKALLKLKAQFEKIQPLKKFFQYSFMELCDLLDSDKDRLIKKEELKKSGPEFLSFFEDWDRNEDGVLSRTDLVLGFFTARTFYQKGLELAEAELEKAAAEAEQAVKESDGISGLNETTGSDKSADTDKTTDSNKK